MKLGRRVPRYVAMWGRAGIGDSYVLDTGREEADVKI